MEVSRVSIGFRRPGNLLLIIFFGLLAGCGGGGGGDDGSGNPQIIQMGGALQGLPLSLSGRVSTLAGATDLALDGTGPAATFDTPKEIASDDTYLYVTDTGHNTIRQIEIATGIVTTLAGSGAAGSADGIGTAASFSVPSGIVHNSGYLYVTDLGNHKIRRVEIATGEVTTFAGSGMRGSTDGIGTAASFNTPYGIAIDGAYLYLADAYNNKIRRIEIATATVTTFAGSGFYGFTDDVGTSAAFRHPLCLTTDGSYLYVVDTYNYRIRRIDIATAAVTTLAGSGSYGSADGIGTAASFSSSYGITNDGGYLYVADTYNNTVRRVEIASGVVTTFAGTLDVQGSANGLGTATSFYRPLGITHNGGYLYVADTFNNTIRRIDVATSEVTGVAGATILDGTGTSARFNQPVKVTTDGAYLYLADGDNNAVRRIEIDTGTVTTLAGSTTPGSTDGTGAAANFNNPYGITTDGVYLYLADRDNHLIRRIGIASGVVTTFAGSGTAGSADGVGTAASFNYPEGITTDGAYLYVADTYSYVIRRIDIASGTVTTFAGSGTTGTADGIGTAASFTTPSGITTDGKFLYVTDDDNHNIRRVDIASRAVTTLAGSGAAGSADGVGTAASFTNPRGITTDGTYLYVADSGSTTLRRIAIASGEVTTLAGSGTPGSADGDGAAASFRYPMGITSDGKALFVTDRETGSVRRVE